MVLKSNLKLTLDYVVKLLSLVNRKCDRIILLIFNIRCSDIKSLSKLVSEAIAQELVFKSSTALDVKSLTLSYNGIM